jgi:very-short-patch-repair endonuclease
MNKSQKSTSSFDQKVIEMYNEQSKSTYEIATALNTYPNKIRRTLIKHGVELKTKSEAQKNALKNGRTDHPTAGKKRSTKERVNISEGMASHWEQMSDEQRNNRVVQAKKRWKEMGAAQRDMMSKLATEAIRKAGVEGSKLEKFIVKKLREQGYRVDFHNKSLIPTEKLEIDIYLPELKTIIEIDGPSHFLPIWGEEKLQKQIKADLHKSGLILSRGYAIIRVKALTEPNFSKKEKLASNIASILNRISDNFPPKTERFIEVDI